MPSVISGYEPYDIFNADETGLYWHTIADGILAFKSCNTDGSEKLEPPVIGKSRNSRRFENIKRLPVEYESNKDAWMTRTLWIEWLKTLDNLMRRRERQIVLLFNNCDVRLTNTKHVPNTTLQITRFTVIDANPESSTRAAELVRKPTVLDSLHMVREAWSRVASSTISSC